MRGTADRVRLAPLGQQPRPLLPADLLLGEVVGGVGLVGHGRHAIEAPGSTIRYAAGSSRQVRCRSGPDTSPSALTQNGSPLTDTDVARR